MNKYRNAIFIISAFLFGLLVANLFDSTDARVNISRSIKYDVISTSDGLYPVKISAFGKLSLSSGQPEEISQIVSLDVIESKILMKEGLVSKNGTITMSQSSYLDIVSFDLERLIAKNDIWTITIQKDSVTLVDKEGRVGELNNGFVGRYEY